MNLLLVTCSPHWAQAVQQAAAALGGWPVSPCEARDALARLAGTACQYSHLLVDHNCAGGLLDALVDLTSETSGSETEMLMLGAPPHIRRGISVIRSPSQSSIREALMLRPPVSNTPEMPIATTELRDALAGSMIEPRYQPIVRMTDRRAVALEALARLRHPERGTLPPDRFVPQIEDAGLGAELTELVCAQAFADLTGPSLAESGLGVTLNFPLDVMLRDEALARLEAQRLAAGLSAGRIMIELTESRPVNDFPALRRSVDRLRHLGYRVAIDDVGPAVPELDQLLLLPFTGIKLDKELVQQVPEDAAVSDRLADIIARAHARGMTVVAEGVETAAIWNHMAALHADAAQGFLVARPLPLAAVPIWLEAWRQAPGFEGEAQPG